MDHVVVDGHENNFQLSLRIPIYARGHGTIDTLLAVILDLMSDRGYDWGRHVGERLVRVKGGG